MGRRTPRQPRGRPQPTSSVIGGTAPIAANDPASGIRPPFTIFGRTLTELQVISALAAFFVAFLGAPGGWYIKVQADRLQDKTTENEHLTAQKRIVDTSLEAANKEMQGLRSDLNTKTQTLNSSQIRIDSLSKAHDEMLESLHTLSADFTKKTDELTALQSSNSEMARQADALNADISYLQNRLTLYRSALAAPGQTTYEGDIERINNLMTSLELIPWSISIANWDIRASYLITRSESSTGSPSLTLISFASTEYTLPRGFQCLDNPWLCAQMCDLITQAASSYQTKQSEAYRAAFNTLMEKEEGLDPGSDRRIIAELTMIARLIKNVSDESYVFLRGTADGQAHNWTRPLVSGYEFNEAKVLDEDAHQCSADRIDCWSFDHPYTMAIPNPYDGAHLPNLRAQYVEANIRSIINNCHSPEQRAAEIRLFDGIDNPNISGRSRSVIGLVIIGQPR